MESASGRFIVVFNGEVYNFVELRDELIAKGHHFRGGSDTEVVVASIEEWGLRKAVERFVGMFAFAVWDRQLRSLSLVRDRIGIKPLFLYRDRSRFAFASELNAFRMLPDAELSVNSAAVADYLRYLYVRAPATIFANVTKVRPGSILTLRSPCDSDLGEESYWSLQDVVSHSLQLREEGVESSQEELEHLIGDAVRLCLRSDVPVGAFLSGGIDSSLLVATMGMHTSHPLKTYTVGFDVAEHDETEAAQHIADQLSTIHRGLRLSSSELIRLVPQQGRLLSEPIADPSFLPLHLVCRAARAEVKVALSGDGGDELFGGYNRYVHGSRVIRAAQRVPLAVRHVAGSAFLGVSGARWNNIGRLVAPSKRGALLGDRLHKVGALLQRDSESAMYDSLLSAWQDLPLTGKSFEKDRQVLSGQLELAEQMMLLDQQHYLPGNLLSKVDSVSMANGLEVRVPFLDHRVVEYSWKFRLDQKIVDGSSKAPLRKALVRHIPSTVFNRPKTGFTVPLAEWLRGPLEEWAGDHLLGIERSLPMVHSDKVQYQWDELRRGQSSSAMAVWTIVSLASWLHPA